MKIMDMVMARLIDEPVDENVIKDYVKTIMDRLCLRLGEETLPASFEGIAADAAVKMYRRAYFEGIASEGVEGISHSFVADILAEYEGEIKRYRESKAKSDGEYLVCFL